MSKCGEALKLFEGYTAIVNENRYSDDSDNLATWPKFQYHHNVQRINPNALDVTNQAKPGSRYLIVDETTAKAKMRYLLRRLDHSYLRRKPGSVIFQNAKVRPDDSLTESVSEKLLHIIKNDKHLDSVKDNFLPPGARKCSEEELEEMKLRHKLALGATAMATFLGAGKAQANETPQVQPDTLHSIAYQKPGATKYDYKYVSGHEGDSIVNAERGKGNNVIHTRHITYPKSGKSDLGYKGIATGGKVVAGKQLLGDQIKYDSAARGLDRDQQLRTHANNPNAQTQFSNANQEYHRWTK